MVTTGREQDAARPARVERPLQARASVRGVLALQLIANSAGAVGVLVFLGIVFPINPTADEQVADLNAIVFGLYLLVTVVVTFPVNRMFLIRAMSWVGEGREPTPVERWSTLSQPLQQTVSAFLVWLGAAVIFGIVNQGQAGSMRIAVGIALAGLITCALLEMLLDRHLRPVFALALQDTEPTRWRREIRTRVMLAWAIGCAVPLIAFGLIPISMDANEIAGSGRRLTVLLLASVLAGGLIMRAASAAVSKPIEDVTDALAQIEEGDLDIRLDVTHIGEIGRLQSGVNAMVAGLRERRRLQDLFGRQVGTDVARQAVEQDPQLGGEAREITALFVDLDDFTAFSENHSPEEVVSKLNAFFAVVIRIVMREGGWVNKFEGDAALCIFGAPGSQHDHAARALRAAAALPGEVRALPDTPSVGIGVATGRVVSGNIGTAERYEYTVIGDAVNVASRLTELVKRDHRYRGGVLASEDTLVAAGLLEPSAVTGRPDPTDALDDVRPSLSPAGSRGAGSRWCEVDTVVLRGRTRPMRIYAVEVAPDDGSPGPG